jgi:hypothetical protein
MSVDAIAWIIAVEKYAGAELTVKQPVGAKALEFADLMLSRMVARVVLSTSLGDNHRPKLDELKERGVVQTGADQADILKALDLLHGKGTLLLYWVGHGIMAPSRQLLCADSRKFSELRVVSADSLLKRLRAPEYPRSQIGFFECCAQVVMIPPAVLDLGGPGNTPTSQFFYHAASAGETASGSTEKAGFSSTVLDALRGSRTFPPDSLSTFFDGLKESLGQISLQTRPFLQRTEQSGDVWSSGDPGKPDAVFDAATVAGLAQSQFDCLWWPLRSAGVKPVEIARAYRDGTLSPFIDALHVAQPLSSVPDLLSRAALQLKLQREFEPKCLRLRLLFQDWLDLHDRLIVDESIGRPERIEDLPRLLLSVLDRRPQENGYRSFLKLLELARRRARKAEPDASGALHELMAGHSLLGPLYLRVVEEMPEEYSPLYLLLAVDWEPTTKAASIAKAWISPGVRSSFDPRELPKGGTFAEQVNTVVQKVIEEFKERPLYVELLSPNELLCMPRELLELVDSDLETCTWLEAQHSITLRWRNRMMGADEKYFRGSWMKKGLEVRANAESAESLFCEWRPPVQDGTSENGHVLGLTFPGPCPSDPRRNRAQFFDELKKGAPYMCWPREAPLDLGSFKRAVANLFGRTKLESLPQALRDGRQGSLLDNLVVLIDEPHRNPYVDHFQETQLRGSS